jgi:NhaP-type Na+/H+ or K+/H+ antiporter
VTLVTAAAPLSTDEILTGLGLVIVLAIACRLAAVRFRVPAIVLLLPVGFLAGAITDDVHPEELFGGAFQPLVSLGVGLILFEAGLRLSMRELGGGVRRVVLRLISGGALLTFASVTVATELIFGLNWGISAVLGAILVVSGPTVVLPLLSFVRPSDRVRSVLKWEGTLIDPLGALLGVVALHAVLQGAAGDRPFHPGLLAGSLAIGAAVGAAGAALLWLLLRQLERSAPGQGVAAALMVLTAAVVGADLLREDSGLVAAAVMGMALAHQEELDVTGILQFHGTVVELLIGILFVLISASVTPDQVGEVIWRGLALVAVLVLLIRPLVVALATRRSELSRRERAFAAWMAPRGIIAAATASAFGLSLTEAGVEGADRVLPIAFVVIFATVVLYGLTAAPVARLLGVAGTGAPLVLLVGGNPWARSIAAALQAVGVRVRLWTGSEGERAAAERSGLEAGPVPLGVDVEGLEAELEEVSKALVMTASDEFNALAAFELRRELGKNSVYRLAPREKPATEVPAHAEGRILFSAELTFPELSRRLDRGAGIVELDGVGYTEQEGAGLIPLFALAADGGLEVVGAGETPRPGRGEKLICLVGSDRQRVGSSSAGR